MTLVGTVVHDHHRLGVVMIDVATTDTWRIVHPPATILLVTIVTSAVLRQRMPVVETAEKILSRVHPQAHEAVGAILFSHRVFLVRLSSHRDLLDRRTPTMVV